MNRAGAAAPPPRTKKPRPPLKTTPVGPPGTATRSACFRPSAVYTVLELRASFATHHAPPARAARPHAFTSWGSLRSETRRWTMNRSVRALAAEPAAASAAMTTATAPGFTSARPDRGRPRRSAPARDEVAVPVEAVLRHAVERRVVDVDDPEPLRVPVRPLEVVEQAPDEVAADRRAVRDRLQDGGDVGFDVRRPLGVVHAPVVCPHVAEGGAVLGHVDRGRRVLLRD